MKFKAILAPLITALVIYSSALPALASPAPQPADPAVAPVWDRTDFPVITHQVNRTWLWGPAPFASLYEKYQQAPGGLRAVQYYDKSRMEITNSSGDRNSSWFVTNGLLTKEMMTGQLQTGDSSFETRSPAQIPVAGDLDDSSGPTYATLGALLAPVGERKAPVVDTLDRTGKVAQDQSLSHYTGDVFFVPETGHNVPGVFWNFLNSSDVIYDGKAFGQGALFSPTFYATGFPITEAYWSRVKVAGQAKWVLIQAFQRRVLTYTPDNPDGWKVEMGNIGQHYYLWRYGTWDRGLEHGKITKVHDGSTYTVDLGIKVALVKAIGVESPVVSVFGQSVTNFGAESAAAAEQLLQGKEVLLEKDTADTDQQGRLLRYVYQGGLFVNDWLARSGYASVATLPPNVRYADGLAEAQRYAQGKNIGLWGPAAPRLTAAAGILIAADSGQIISAKNFRQRLPMASTTKIMTALLILERGSLNDVVTVVKDDLVGESTADLVEGEQITVGNLLYGLLLPSGNDAAMALARYLGGSLPGAPGEGAVQRFIDLMNARAGEMGLTDTHFVTPHGLDEPNHYTTALDLVTIARYAMRIPKFAEIVQTRTYECSGHTWKQTNKLLDRYWGASGIKTGYTGDAGLCLVFSAGRDGQSVIGVVLNDDNWYDDSATLLDYGFNRLDSGDMD